MNATDQFVETTRWLRYAAEDLSWAFFIRVIRQSVFIRDPDDFPVFPLCVLTS